MFAKSGFAGSYFTPCYFPPGGYPQRRGGPYVTSYAYESQDLPQPSVRLPSLMEAIAYARRILALGDDEEEAIILLATAMMELDDD